MQSLERPTKVIREKAIGHKSKFVDFKMEPDSAKIYALAIGMNQDQLDKSQFKFTYEHDENFTVFPTYPSGMPINTLIELLTSCPGIPDFNLMMLLHGEQEIDCIKPLPTTGNLIFQLEIADVQVKEKGSTILVKTTVMNKEDKTVYSILHGNFFVRGMKGDVSKSNGSKDKVLKVPDTKPLKEVTLKTSPNQALIYRIGGLDPNPLHVDPDMASIGGFDKPILHGLCFYGMVAKATYEEFCDGKLENFLNYKARFTSHVFPGESILVKFWKQSSNKLVISAETVERKKQVLIGEVTLKNAKF